MATPTDASLVSVVLPVYNGAATIEAAVRSILDQTHAPLELIVIDDGSTDATARILETQRDRRLRVVHQDNQGLVPALNRGIALARGRYIARMDADDVSLPERLERQVGFLEAHPRVAVVGTAARVRYPDGRESVRYRPPDTVAIRRNIARINPFFHSSVMIRREVFDRVGLYDPSKDSSRRTLVEDYDLWSRILCAGYDLANLREPLLVARQTPGSIIRGRSLRGRLRRQILVRVDVIRTMRLGYLAYANLVPVVAVSLVAGCGFRIDGAFNFLARRLARRARAEGQSPWLPS